MANPNMDMIRELIAASGLEAPTIEEQRAAMEAMMGAGRAARRRDGGAHRDRRPARRVDRSRPAGAVTGSCSTCTGAGTASVPSTPTGSWPPAWRLASQGRVLTLDYRLAPEHPFPAGLDDATRAYRELVAKACPGRLAIGGDSAGGGLTLATLVALRDAGDPLPATAVLLSPWTDLTADVGDVGDPGRRRPDGHPDGLDLMARPTSTDGRTRSPGIAPLSPS